MTGQIIFGGFAWMFLVDLSVQFGISPIPSIVDHDPQKLLPSPEKARPLTLRERVGLWARDYMADYRERLFKTLFDPIPPVTRETYHVIDGQVLAVDHESAKRAIYHHGYSGDDITLLKPRERTYEHKMAVVSTEKVNSETLKRLMTDKRIRVIRIDADSPGGSIPGAWNHPHSDPLGDIMRMREHVYRDMPPSMGKTEISAARFRALNGDRGDKIVNRRSKDYLRHDPTKNQGRRRR